MDYIVAVLLLYFQSTNAFPDKAGMCEADPVAMAASEMGPTVAALEFSASIMPSANGATVKINGKTKFRGLLLYVQDSTGKHVGAFNPPPGFQTLDRQCSQFPPGSTLSHSSSTFKNPGLQFQWISNGAQGPLTLTGIIVGGEANEWQIISPVQFSSQTLAGNGMNVGTAVNPANIYPNTLMASAGGPLSQRGATAEGRIPYNPEKQGGMQNNLGREMLLETAFGTLALAGAQVKRMFTLMNNLNMKSNPDTMTQTSIPEAPFMSLGMTPKGNFNNFAEKDILLLLATINAQAQVLKSLEIEFNFLQSQAKPNSEIKGMNNPIAVVQAQGIPQGAKPEGTTPPGAILANLAQAVQQNQPAGVQKGLPEALKTPPLQAAPGPLTEIAAAGTVQALPEAIKT
jgi:hypothetical protein